MKGRELLPKLIDSAEILVSFNKNYNAYSTIFPGFSKQMIREVIRSIFFSIEPLNIKLVFLQGAIQFLKFLQILSTNIQI